MLSVSERQELWILSLYRWIEFQLEGAVQTLKRTPVHMPGFLSLHIFRDLLSFLPFLTTTLWPPDLISVHSVYKGGFFLPALQFERASNRELWGSQFSFHLFPLFRGSQSALLVASCMLGIFAVGKREWQAPFQSLELNIESHCYISYIHHVCPLETPPPAKTFLLHVVTGKVFHNQVFSNQESVIILWLLY